MKLLCIRPVALLVAPLFLAFVLPADEVGFHPKADDEVAKRLSIELELEMHDLSFKVNGETMPPEALGELGASHLLVKMLVGATDKYLASKENRPTDLVRSFNDMSLDLEIADEKKSVDEFKQLESKSVRFKWNAEKKEYDKSFHDSKGDVDELEDLNEDMDLRALLPESKVSDGDTWNVPAERLMPLFLPGGIAGHPKGDDETEFKEIRDSLKSQLEPLLKDFKVVCKYKGSRDEGGLRVADIRFTFEGKAKLELSQILAKLSGDEGQSAHDDTKADLGLDLKGEGGLLWDQTAGHMHAFEMQSDIAATIDIQSNSEEDGERVEVAITASAGGKANWKLTAGKP